MLFFLLCILVVFFQANSIDPDCQKNPSCRFDNKTMTVTCDSVFSKNHESEFVPILSCFPPVAKYFFRNFHRIQSNTFQYLIFPENQSFTIQLNNISVIEPEAFGESINLPESSDLTVEIEHSNSSGNIILRPNAFNHIKIDRLRFFNLKTFDERSLLDTNCFGNSVQISQLIVEQCGLTGFLSIIQKSTEVDSLAIINSPELIELTAQNLPAFLSTTKSLVISNTGLQNIDAHTFHGPSLILEELIISNNSKLETFPSDIVDVALTNLYKLDLSYNPIRILDEDYNWSAYSSTVQLLLRNQQLDLFLKTNILKQLPQLEIIDFAEGFVIENNDDLMKTYFSNVSNLISIDVSYTNLTENMVIDLLTDISKTTDHFVDIHLRGRELSDEHFCSYFTIFKNAPNLLNLQLDDTHICNCVIDLFFMDNLQQNIGNDSVLQPTCLFNASRTPCDIQKKLSTSKCPQNPDGPSTDNNIGKYAFGAIMTGLSILLLVLISLGFTVVYQIRRRNYFDLFMEQPVENPSDAIIDEPY